jgi:hypothetical protein
MWRTTNDMIILIWILIIGACLLCSINAYLVGKKSGREEAYMEKAIEVIPYGKKNIVLISEDYFTIEQAAQIKDAIKKDKPIIYKPKKHV